MEIKYKIKIITSILFIFGILVISGCGCKPKNPKQYNVSLEVWGPFDQGTSLQAIFNNYRQVNPNVGNITYKKIALDTYKTEILDALASGQGPDIFLIGNSWVPSFQDKIVAAPQVKGIINEQKFRNNFIDVAIADFIEEGKIYSVPLSVNSLGLYYNKDLFNQVGIALPPKTWNEFIDDVRKLTQVDANGNIIQSGAAIGTADNINRSTDILNLLMFQNGVEMIDDGGRVAFDKGGGFGENYISPGENALNFYTQFADSGSQNYTWNSSLHYSIDAFAEGKTAMMLNYSWNMEEIENKSPKLNYAIAPIPQFENKPKVNFANYWSYAVAKNKIAGSSDSRSASPPVSNDIRVKEAWKFLTYLTTKPDGTFAEAKSSSPTGPQANTNFDPAKEYLIKSGEPAARRDLIELQKADPKIGVFATDNLIAKSWKQTDPDAIEAIFKETINSVVKGQSTVSEAIKLAAQRVQKLSDNNLYK